jgi:hypothetical protein
MHVRPLPIPGLPIAPSADGLTAGYTTHATSSHPQKPIPPHPALAESPPASHPPAAALAILPVTISEEKANRPRTFAKRERPSYPQSRSLAAAAIFRDTTSVGPDSPDRTTILHAETSTARNTDRITSTSHTSDQWDDLDSLYPTRNHPTSPPRFQPAQTEAFDFHDHPLAIREPRDVFRFFPLTITASAVLASMSGLFTGQIAKHVFGIATEPAIFVGAYLTLFLLHLLTHYFSSKGQLFFNCRARFLRLFIVSALLFLPHFIAYTILVSMMEK